MVMGVVFQIGISSFQTGRPHSSRLLKQPMMMSCSSLALEKPIALRARRLRRVRHVRCFRSMGGGFPWPGLWTAGSRCRAYAPP